MPCDPTFSTAIHPDLGPDAAPEAALRACVDLPAMVRTHGLRMIVSAGAVAFAGDEPARDAARGLWARSVEGYRAAAACLDPAGGADLHRVVRAVIADVLPEQPAGVAVVARFAAEAEALMAAVEAGAVAGEYDALMAFTYGTYVPRMAELEAAIVRRVEAWHGAREAAARDARGRAHRARGEIGRIARTVRTISLNARVEAARAGEAGRPFDVIAAEIRALSERTEAASRDMGASIDAILENRRVR